MSLREGELSTSCDSRKKVCVVTTSPLVVNFFLGGILEVLARRFDVSLIVNTQDGTEFRCLPHEIRLLSVRIERKISPIRDLKALWHLFRIFHRERFDIVHSFAPKAGLLAMLAARFAGIPARVHTFQGEVWANRQGFFRWILKLMDTLTAHCASDSLVISRTEREFLMSEGVLEEKSSRILADGSVCGVELARFEVATQRRAAVRSRFAIELNDLVFLYLGRLTKDKGVLDLACAFSTVAARFDNVHLLVVGPDEEGLVPEIRRLSGDGNARVHVCGYTDHPEDYIGAADAVCLPSYREGLGMVLLEAGAAGLPAIASRIYGITDAVVEGETALLHRPGDVNELTEHLTTLIEDSECRSRMGARAHEWVARHFSHDRVMNAYIDYYERVLARSVTTGRRDIIS